jgi:hypothetical protein
LSVTGLFASCGEPLLSGEESITCFDDVVELHVVIKVLCMQC